MVLRRITITRVRRKMVHDPMSGGSTLGDWSDADHEEISRCLFAPGTSEEFPAVELEMISQLGTLYMPFRADVAEFDRVIVDGGQWDVIGRPSNWRGSRVSGSRVPLRWVRPIREVDGE